MAHTPHTWVTGETIAAAPLNLLEQDLAAAAPLASPAFTGTPTIGGTAIAKTTDITAAISGLVGGASAAYDTLGELATQLTNDENAAATLTTLVGTKAALLTTAATRTASATIATDTVNPADATAGAVTFTLPTPTKAGQRIVVEKVDATGNTVTVSGTIRGAVGTVALVWQFETLELIAESLTSWRPVAGHKTKAALDAAYFNVLGTASNPVTNAAAARPTGLTKVFWQCPTQPTNWVTGDEWINNA